MRVLVTGGLGFIGQHTVRALLARGDEVTILDARTAPVHDPAAPVAVPVGVRMVEGDVCDPGALDDALGNADAVIHLAAYQDYGSDHARFMRVNAGSTALLIERIVATETPIRRIVLASSQAVYGEGAVSCERDGPQPASPRRLEDLARGSFAARCSRCGQIAPPAVTPPEMVAPVNAYGISKLAAERLVLTIAAQYGIEGVALRYAIVHGPGQSPRNAYSGILRAAVLRAIAKEPPMIFEDGNALREYLGIDDAVSATLLALDHPAAAGGAFAVGGARAMSVLELLDALASATGLDLAPEMTGLFRVGDVRHTLASTSELRSLGWTPAEDLAPTWVAYLAWLREQAVDSKVVAGALDDMRMAGILRPFSN